jgi:signal peptide peptidase SppA
MIARAKLEVILSVLAPRLSGDAPMRLPGDNQRLPPPIAITGGIAVVPVMGTLVSRSGYVAAESGLHSYGEVGRTIEEAMQDQAVRGVLLDIDSAGGEVGGLFDLVDRIRALKAASSKPLWAVANESALSAAYAIASTADRIYVTRTGEVGSIGIVAVHVDESGADAQEGLAWTYIFAGERKVDGNPHEALSARARATIQADVDRLHEQFCTLVAVNRGLIPDTVRATEAAIYRGELAISSGLADRTGTLEQAAAEMMSELESGPGAPVSRTSLRKTMMTTNEATHEPLVAGGSEPHVPRPEVQELANSLRAEYAEIAAVAAQAARLGVEIDAADAMRRGICPDALRRSVLETLAQRAEVNAVVSTAPVASSNGESPIVRRARERAGAFRA